MNMNKDFIISYKAILWKEIMEGIRSSKFTFPFAVVMIIVMQYLPILSVMENKIIPEGAKVVMLGRISFFIPLLIIPFLGNQILIRTIYEGKRNKTIQILMASGICPSIIWFGKFSIAAMVSYVSSLFAVVGYGLFVKFYIGRTIAMDFNQRASVFFVLPVIATGVLSLVSLGYWAFKNGQILGTAFMMIVFFGIWSSSIHFRVYPAALTNAVMLGAGIIMIGLSSIGVKIISKERITNI